jgi:gustatory receptor
MYGFQILLALGVTTAELTLSSYLMLETILGILAVDPDTTGTFIFLMTGWLLLYAFKLIFITAPCQSATNEVENTVMLVQKLLLAGFDQSTMAELQLFSQQLLNRKMNFTAFGFLTLDYSLLLTIIGGVITYVVIAMQYIN